jgi:tRNA dimethylallyltransferase
MSGMEAFTAEAPLVAIVGPTASGKSELALAVARRFPAEIVNCDSVQLYRYLDIGTAKLSPAERQGVPHHMIDVADPDELITAGDYARRVRPLLREIAARGRLPLLVGGTGFYLRALLEGLFPGPQRDPALRQRLARREAARPGSLHRILKRLDPPSAARIHPHDVNKLIRALEVCLLARQPLSRLWAEGRDSLRGFRPLKIGLDPPRTLLYTRLDQRCRAMFDRGLIEEVRQILARGFPETSKPLESLGYRQALEVLRGRLEREEAIRLTQRETRRYAKRQWTWFRRDPAIEWFQGFGSDEAVQQAVIRRIESYLLELAWPTSDSDRTFAGVLRI